MTDKQLKTLDSIDREELANLLEIIIQQSGRSSERSQVARIVEDAFEAHRLDPSVPGEESAWWTAAIDVTQSLGLKSKIVDCRFSEFVQLADEGAKLITRLELPEGNGRASRWLAVADADKQKYLVCWGSHNAKRRWLSLQQVYAELGPVEEQTVRCLVLETGLPADVVHVVEGHHHRSTTGMLWQLLRPEWPDIWVIVLFAIVSGFLSLATPLAIESLVNTVAFGNLLQPVVVLSIMLLTFLLFLAAIKGLQTYVVEIIQRRLFARVMADLAYRLPRARMGSYHDHAPREMLNRFFDVMTVQKVSATLLLDGVSLVLSTLIGMAVLAFYHPWLLGFDVVLVILIGVTIFVLGYGAIETAIIESKAKYEAAAWLQDLAGSETTFRHYGGAELAMERADRLTHTYLSARKKHFQILIRQIMFALVLQALASTVLLGMGGWLVVSGQLTLGQLVAAELIVTMIVSSFAKLGKHMESYYDLLAAVDKLGYLFGILPEDQRGSLMMPTQGPASVEIRDVCCVDRHHHDAITELSLIIKPGHHLAVSGSSSTGPSTLMEMLFGMAQPSAGHLMIDGVDPRDLRPDILRKHVVLLREIEIFAGSLSENVHLQRPDISMTSVREALSYVGLLEDALKLPEGIETRLISDGSPLTFDQMRRLMLARGIAARPRLLLIDRLLDSLADDQAKSILKYLTEKDQPWTLVLVTGRASLAGMCELRLNMTSGHAGIVSTHHEQTRTTEETT